MKMDHPFFLKSSSYLILLFLLIVPAVSAESTAITFSELNVDWGTNQEILIYDGMGNFVQTINTTSSIVLDTDNFSSYLFVFRPTQDMWFKNPMNAFELIKMNFGPMISFAVILFAVFGIIAIAYSMFFRRR